MSAIVESDLEKLARDAVEHVAGPGVVEEIEVTEGVDYYYRPAYLFSLLINMDNARIGPGLLRIRLSQKLRDDLDAKGDDRLPVLEMLDAADWVKRRDAKSKSV